MICKILILICFVNRLSAFDLKFKNQETRNEYIFPNRPYKSVQYAVEGEQVIFKLSKVPTDFSKCTLTAPDADLIHTLEPDVQDDRIIYWNPDSKIKGCGARIKNISIEDSGRWKLKAINIEQNKQLQSMFTLKVLKKREIVAENINVAEGSPTQITLSSPVDYCEITNQLQFDSEQSLFDKCNITIPVVNKHLNGQWTANVGIYGQVQEATLKSNIHVIPNESFDVGFKKAQTKINLYCHLKNPINGTNFTTCRFMRKNPNLSLRMFDGLSNGKYSYYGNSLSAGDCGMTIENPTDDDFTTWTCNLGFYKPFNQTKIYQVKESIISLTEHKNTFKSTFSDSDQIAEILSSVGNPLTISCSSNSPLQYCVITHPNQTTFAVHENYIDKEWKSKGKLTLGECGMTIFKSTLNETGTWLCQMGSIDPLEMDTVEKYTVRIASTSLVAIEPVIQTELGSSLTLKCIAVSVDKTLDYCRFTLPNNQTGFNLNNLVTKNKAIQDQYWYEGTKLEDGDCQVTIKQVESRHIGQWKCAAKVSDSQELESYDYIQVNTNEDTLSVASISGIVVGVGGLLILTISGSVYYKIKLKRRRNPVISSHRSSSSSSEIPMDAIVPQPQVELNEEENNNEARL